MSSAHTLTDVLPTRLTGKLPILPGRTEERPESLDPDLVARLAAIPTADLSDLVGRLYTMDARVRPLWTGCPPMTGTAVTVRTPRGDNAPVKAAVAEIRPGDVLVIDAQGFTDWCSGGWGMLRAATSAGALVGVVVDGAYRDVAQFSRAGVPLWGVATSPATGPKLSTGEINTAVGCGGVIVRPGDVVRSDEDGLVVVPRAAAAEVVVEAERRAAR